jgi:hypothetical protein
MIKMLALISCLLSVACSKNRLPVQTVPSNPVGVVADRVVHVATAAGLQKALLEARPGDAIYMADGLYQGRFVIGAAVNGTAGKPIQLTGSRKVILDGGNTNSGYVLHLQASYWKLKGFTVTNGLKGLMADGATHVVIDSLFIHTIGEEGIHLRKFSSHNTIQQVTISHTGLKTPDYGEGIYIGSAKNHWGTMAAGLADQCDSNLVFNNHIGPMITAECIDLKEGTTGGIIRNNYFDATGITGANAADSWIDVKGNYTLIENNTGTHPGGTIFKDGYQVHVAVNGWGNFNEFKNNTCSVNAAGYGFNIQLRGSNGTSTGNKVYDNNSVTGAALGISNIALSQ